MTVVRLGAQFTWTIVSAQLQLLATTYIIAATTVALVWLTHAVYQAQTPKGTAIKDQLVYRSWLLLKISLGLLFLLEGIALMMAMGNPFTVRLNGWHLGRFILGLVFGTVFIPTLMYLIPGLALLISKRKRLVIVFSYAAATTSITMALIATLVLLAKGFIKPLDLVFMVPMFLQIPGTAVALAWLTHAVYKKHEPESISVKG